MFLEVSKSVVDTTTSAHIFCLYDLKFSFIMPLSLFNFAMIVVDQFDSTKGDNFTKLAFPLSFYTRALHKLNQKTDTEFF